MTCNAIVLISNRSTWNSGSGLTATGEHSAETLDEMQVEREISIKGLRHPGVPVGTNDGTPAVGVEIRRL